PLTAPPAAGARDTGADEPATSERASLRRRRRPPPGIRNRHGTRALTPLTAPPAAGHPEPARHQGPHSSDGAARRRASGTGTAPGARNRRPAGPSARAHPSGGVARMRKSYRYG